MLTVPFQYLKASILQLLLVYGFQFLDYCRHGHKLELYWYFSEIFKVCNNTIICHWYVLEHWHAWASIIIYGLLGWIICSVTAKQSFYHYYFQYVYLLHVYCQYAKISISFLLRRCFHYYTPICLVSNSLPLFLLIIWLIAKAMILLIIMLAFSFIIFFLLFDLWHYTLYFSIFLFKWILFIYWLITGYWR